MKMLPPTPDRPYEIPEQLQDFKAFMFMAWRYLGHPSPTPVQYAMGDFLQNGGDASIIEAFRGVGKSAITSAFVAWYLLLNPQKKVMVISSSSGRADAFSEFTKSLIYGMPVLAPLRARKGQKNSNVKFDVGPAKPAPEPSVKSVGITGQMTGSRADILIADDIESSNNSMTQGQREKLFEKSKEFVSILKPNGRIIVLGTPQSFDSVYNEMEKVGYVCKIWPVRYPTDAQVDKYKGRLAEDILERRTADNIGKSTEPDRFSDEDIDSREAKIGHSAFSLQFMLDTDASDALKFPLKLSDLIVTSLDNDLAPPKISWGGGEDYVEKELPNVGFTGDRYHKPLYISETVDYRPYEGGLLVIDPSGRGADETAYAVLKIMMGYVFLLEVGGISGGYDELTLTKLANIAKRHKVNTVLTESNFGDGMFERLLTPYLNRIHPCPIEEVRHTTQKELRIIQTLEPLMNQHRLIVHREVVERDFNNTLSKENMLFYQLTHISKDKGCLAHDDRIDVVAMGVAYWIERFDADQDLLRNNAEEEDLMRELEEFLGAAGGYDGLPPGVLGLHVDF